MKVRASLCIVLCIVLCVAWGCATDKKTSTTARYTNMMGCTEVVTASGIARMAIDDSICVILEENPSTGYTWEYTEEPEGLLDIIDVRVFEDEDADPKLIGAPVTKVWKFSAVKVGEVTLTYVYHRPWETGIEPSKTETYRISIKP